MPMNVFKETWRCKKKTFCFRWGKGFDVTGRGGAGRKGRKGLEMMRALRGRSSEKGLRKEMLQEFKER